jgi:hypothetical protein
MTPPMLAARHKCFVAHGFGGEVHLVGNGVVDSSGEEQDHGGCRIRLRGCVRWRGY